MDVLSESRALTIADLRRLAKRRLPRMVFDYIDGGAEDEITLRENCTAFQRVRFRPRSAVRFGQCDLTTKVLGAELGLPFILGPVGSSRMFYPRGEALAAEAAGRAGTAYTLSTLSGTPMEEVRAASTGPCWYQLYLAGGNDVALAALARARQAGYSALVVTIDTAVSGVRERDFRNGVKPLLSGNPLLMAPHIWQIVTRPGWLARYLADGGLMSFPNVMLPDGPMPYADVTAALEQAAVTWEDLRWIREAWPCPLAVKGVQIADDALRALDLGVDAVIVSNHGGRQLDNVAPSLVTLPEVVAAVDGRAEVLMDGGIRRGTDVVKALCLGAKAVLIGRAYAYGLGAAGGAGVARAIQILRDDVVRTMKLLGCPSVSALGPSFVEVSAG
jgi:L-lactate dehydrogenase (cytochrome)